MTAPILFAMEEFPQLRTIVDKGFEDPTNVDLVSLYAVFVFSMIIGSKRV